jgi:hypothetical protein
MALSRESGEWDRILIKLSGLADVAPMFKPDGAANGA